MEKKEELVHRDDKQESADDSFSEDVLIPDEIRDALKDVPESDRKQIESVVQSSFRMMGQVHPESLITKKVTSEHITEYLSGARKSMENGFRERRDNKIFVFLLVFIALVFFVVLVVLLKSNPALLEKIITAVVGLVAGAFGGYGVGRHKRSREEDD